MLQDRRSMMSKDFFKAALIRAIKTWCQVAVSMLTVGVGFMDVNWIDVISVSTMSMLTSILTSIATGLPEVGDENDV